MGFDVVYLPPIHPIGTSHRKGRNNALQAKPDDPDGFYTLGNVYADTRQNAKAMEAYRKVLELNPKFARANYNIGVIYLNENNKAGAMEQYNALLVTDKDLAEKLKKNIDILPTRQ